MATIDLYTFSTPNGYKASIMLEETGLDYDVHKIDIMKDDQFAPEFLKISPNNKIPAIVDNDNGMTLMESGAILVYLARKTGQLLAPDGEEHWRCLEWLMWQMGGFGPMLGQAHHFYQFNPDVSDYAKTRYTGEAQRLYGVLNKRLGDSGYLAGDEYSIADVATFPWVARHPWQNVDLNDFPNVRRWYTEIAGRPAVQKGVLITNPDYELPMP